MSGIRALSVSEEILLERAIKVVNGNYHNAKVLSELADSFERVERQAVKLGLRLMRDNPHTPTATLVHHCGDVETVLIKDAMIEAIERVLPRIHRTEAKDGKPERYALLSNEVEA